MNIRLLQVTLLFLSIAMLYAKKNMSIQPLSPQQSLAELNQDQPEINPEYERAFESPSFFHSYRSPQSL